MATRAETAIHAHTKDIEGGYRVFYRGDSEVPQFRIQTAPGGGYFREEAIGGGMYWQPQAYALTAGDLNANAIPPVVWDDRERKAEKLSAAFAALKAAGVEPSTAMRDIRDLGEHEDVEIRDAIEVLAGMRYILVWPEDVIASDIAGYREQWAEMTDKSE